MDRSHSKPNKTDAGSGSNGICHLIGASRSPYPDPNRSAGVFFMLMRW
jgi:hypothetical protein